MEIKQATKYANNTFQSGNHAKTLKAISLESNKAVNAANCLGERFLSLNIVFLPYGITKVEKS